MYCSRKYLWTKARPPVHLRKKNQRAVGYSHIYKYIPNMNFTESIKQVIEIYAEGIL